MTLKEQIEEQERIRRIATQERNRLIDLRDSCKHDWIWDTSCADNGYIVRTCPLCGKEEIFSKEK